MDVWGPIILNIILFLIIFICCLFCPVSSLLPEQWRLLQPAFRACSWIFLCFFSTALLLFYFIFCGLRVWNSFAGASCLCNFCFAETLARLTAFASVGQVCSWFSAWCCLLSRLNGVPGWPLNLCYQVKLLSFSEVSVLNLRWFCFIGFFASSVRVPYDWIFPFGLC